MLKPTDTLLWIHSSVVPAKGVSEGFGERNAVVGNTWSTYLEDEQKVFSPELFERLCITTSEAYALTQTPRGIPSLAHQDPPDAPAQPKTSFKPLSDEEVTTYVPIFKRLVNLNKVSGDLHEGRLWRHSAKFRCRSREQLMKLEISKVVRQVRHLTLSHSPILSNNQSQKLISCIVCVDHPFTASRFEESIQPPISPAPSVLEPCYLNGPSAFSGRAHIVPTLVPSREKGASPRALFLRGN